MQKILRASAAALDLPKGVESSEKDSSLFWVRKRISQVRLLRHPHILLLTLAAYELRWTNGEGGRRKVVVLETCLCLSRAPRSVGLSAVDDMP